MNTDEKIESAWKCECDDDFVQIAPSRGRCERCNTTVHDGVDSPTLYEAIAHMPGIVAMGRTITHDEREFLKEVSTKMKKVIDIHKEAVKAEKRGENILEIYRDPEDDCDDRARIVRAIKDLMHAGRVAGAYPYQLIDAAREQFRQEDPT